MFRSNCVYLLVALVLLTMGCSSGSVVSPDNQNSKSQTDISSLPVWVSDFDSENNPSGGLGMLGLFDVCIDTKTLTGEMISLRSSMSSDVLEVVDITNFLQMAPCSDCAGIRGIEISPEGNIVVQIGIRHPFEPGDILKPITGRNRADLHVFNVEGIVVSDGASVSSFANLGVSTGGFNLVNADGFTGYLDSSLDEIFPTDANIHPFITHFADYSQGTFDASNPMGFESVTDPPPSGNLVMAMGCDEDIRDYEFDLSDGIFDFIYAIGCTYAVSADSKSLRFEPEYRIPQHNKKAASYVNVVVDLNDLSGGDTASEAQLTIEVLDINHGVVVGTNLNEMRADSSISAIAIEISGVTLAPTTFDITPTGGDGRDPLNPLTFTGTILNEAGAVEGIYAGLVKVTDSYSTGLNESSLLNGMDGIKRVDPTETPLNGLFEISEFASYQQFEISVSSSIGDPVAILSPDPANGCGGGTIWFDGSASYDTDGTIDIYEFDFDLLDGDPANFTADISGSDELVQSTPYLEGTYFAALKVIDNLGNSDIDVVDVIVDAGGSLDVDPYPKVYVTDLTLGNCIFTSNAFHPNQSSTPQRGLEAMAVTSEHIYAVFYAEGTEGNGVYIARSDDDGATWGNYNFVYELTPGWDFSGAAIDAVGSEVFITIGEWDDIDYIQPYHCPQSSYFAYNNNNGEGGFDILQLSDTRGHSSISVVVDPIDTNNIYTGLTYGSGSHYHNHIWIYVSNNGPAGPFVEHQITTHMGPIRLDQAYTSELKISPDRDVYLFMKENTGFEIFKSEDFGATFDLIHLTRYDPIYYWGRDADCCFDPNDSNIIHWVTTYRYPTGYEHAYRRSTDGGLSWQVITENLHEVSSTAYTNVSVTTDIGGNLYIVYTDKESGNGEVYGRFSNDQGLTLGPEIQISNDPLNDGHVEIVTTTNGCDVVIGWLEDRDGARRVVSRRG